MMDQENIKDEVKESIISKNIYRYPFNGRSNYLIDKFYIIGYNIPTINKLLFEENDDENLSKNINIIKNQSEEEKNKSSSLNLQAFNLNEDPILLNEFASDFQKECLDFNMIRDMILPNKIRLYYSEQDLSSYLKESRDINDNEIDEFEQYEELDFTDNDYLKTTSMVYSSNPQAENNSKKSINGLAYIFYKQLKRRKILSKKVISFYIPIIFSIVSEFPFYNSFYLLCKQIRYLYNHPKNEIPVEIILHNIIANTYSPINSDIIISLKPFVSPSTFNLTKSVNKNEINEISEIVDEEEDLHCLINDTNTEATNKTSWDKDILKNKCSYDIGQKEELNKPKTAKTSRKFMKKQSQVLSSDAMKVIGNELVVNYESPSPSKKRNNPSKEKDKEPKARKRLGTKVMNTCRTKFNKRGVKNKTGHNIDLDDDKLFTKIKFEFLTGYPLIQYNLAKVLFYTLTPSDVIDIFFYTFLEKDVIFFSKNLQYLSLTINSYLNLNFPLNDEKYYFINASVSFENYLNGNSTFVGQTFTTIIGINEQYQPNYINSSNKLKEHLVVDLDKGELYQIDDKKNKKGTKHNKELFNLIKKMCGKKELKNDKKYNILKKEIFILNKKLTEIYSLLNNNSDTELEKKQSYKIFKQGDFIEYDDQRDNYIKKTNLEIQNGFYRMINILCLYFYQNLMIKTDDDDLNKNKAADNNKTETNVIFKDDYKYENEKERTYTKEEFHFLEELRQTMKYESFVYGFVQSYSPIDLYKIPLTFTEEFLAIISRKNSILNGNINFLAVIDQLYKNRFPQAKEINFCPLISLYFKKYRNELERIIYDFFNDNVFNEELIKIRIFTNEYNTKKHFKYRDYELDTNLLMEYLNLINNEEENEIKEVTSELANIRTNIPRNILVIDVENLIECYSIETHLLSKSDLCCSNIILLLSLSLNFLDSNIDCQSFLGHIFCEFTVFRKYYSYIMNMIYLLFTDCLNKGNYSRAQFYLLNYYICVNSIRNLRLVPNESLMNIIKKFNGMDLKKFHENVMEYQCNNENTNNQGNIIENKIFEREPLTTKNIFCCYNFTKNRFVKENVILEQINGQVNNDFCINIEGDTIQPKIKYNNKLFKIESFFYSQTSLLTQLIKIYNIYIVDFNEMHVCYKLLLDSCLNIIVYMRNCSEFKDKEEINDIVEIIFFLFLNKLVETNIRLNDNTNS